MSKDTGGQASPLPCTSDVAGGVHWAEEGMTLRDYFAAKVIGGLAANPGGPWQANSQDGWALANCKLEDVVEVAYQTADAMITERSKQ